jgi:hypothetical protein
MMAADFSGSAGFVAAGGAPCPGGNPAPGAGCIGGGPGGGCIGGGVPVVMTAAAYLRYSNAVRVIGLTVVLCVGCVRDPAAAECPTVSAGDLVVTELRGPQNPEDLDGPWIELFNRSSASLDLEGTKIRFRRKDGSSEVPVIVRRSLPVPAGAYVVLGMVNDDGNRPAHIDYGFALDFHQTFLAAAAVDVEACGQRIDLAVYDALPRTGTYSLGIAPDANLNDDPAAWCENTTSAGTPKQANPACP